MRFAVPIVPSVNHCYRNDQYKRRVLTDTAVRWKNDAQIIAKAAARKQGWCISRGQKLVMAIWVFWPDARKRDTHNCHKLLGDAFNGLLYEDDSTVLIRDMDYQIDRKQPRVEVELFLLEKDKKI